MKKGFTLIELLVVVGMIALIMGAFTTSVTAARKRARIQKATAEVKAISQAILAYENWNKDHTLDEMTDKEIDSSVDFLFGKENAASDGKIPVLLMAQFKGEGKMLDPWGHPYKITIRSGGIPSVGAISLRSGYAFPNYYRLAPEERQ